MTAHEKDLQLIRDVDTRWSSTLLMINRAIYLEEVISSVKPEYHILIICQVIDQFTHRGEFTDLHKYRLEPEDWDKLKEFQEILEVCFLFDKPVQLIIVE